MGISEEKIKQALDLYSKGKISMWKCARLADISLWQMMEIVAERNILVPYEIRELKEDLSALND